MQKKLLQLLLLCCTVSVMAQPVPQVIKQINPNTNSIDYGHVAMAVLDDYLYFGANDLYGYELWKTDGTEAGTENVIDLCFNCTGFNPESGKGKIAAYKGKIYFAGSSGVDNFLEDLYRTDGTASGTELFIDINGFVNYLEVVGDLLFFNSTNGIYVTDGTIAGTQLLFEQGKTYNGAQYYGNTFYHENTTTSSLYVTSIDDGYLYVTDGTVAGTRAIRTSADQNVGSRIESIKGIGDKIYFGGVVGGGDLAAWVSDGTQAGTQKLADLPINSNEVPFEWTAHNGRVYFLLPKSYGSLWSTDGTPANTMQFSEPDIDPYYNVPNVLASTPNGLFISSGYTNFDKQPHLIREGESPELITTKFKDGAWMFPDNGKVYCSGRTDGGFTDHLYVSDGTDAGTERLWDPNSVEQFEYPSYLRRFRDKLVFAALLDNGIGWQLMSVDIGPLMTPNQEVAQIQDCQIFPNPSTNSIQITLPADFQTQDAQVQVYGVDGKLLQQLQFTGTDVDISALPKGQYILKVLGGKGAVAVSSFVKI